MNKCVCTCVALLVGVLNAPTHAQPAPESTAASVPFILRDRPEGLIHLDVTVTDSEGKPAAGLRASDVRLLENGRDQKILSFQAFTGRGAGAEPPVKIILVIDTFQVPPELARDERDAVMFFLRKNGGRLARPTSVFQLSQTGLWEVTHPSSDGNALAGQMEHNELTVVRRNVSGEGVEVLLSGQRGSVPVQGPSSPDGIALMALGQIATEERRQPGRKLLLWIGPGWGIGSGAVGGVKPGSDLLGTVSWFSTLLREAHLALYSFAVGEMDPRGQLYKDYLSGVRSSHQASMMNLYRKVLAVQSGGRVIDGGLDIEAQIENCVQEAGPFYRISFDPFSAEHLDEYHDLKVELDEQGLSARTNTGYYDRPYYAVDQIPPLKRVSLEELQKILELDISDSEKACQLTGLELTVRLSERKLATLYDIAHGKRTRQHLRILADASAFLDPPADEILPGPPPGTDQQQHMMSMFSDYLASAIHKLPDYFARRMTTRYQETPMYLDTGVNYQPLHQTDSSTTTVRYRNGREDTDAKSHWPRLGNPELITYGVFGPVLQDVLHAIQNGNMKWVRWEQDTAGRAAVFRVTISSDQSTRYPWICCLPDGDGKQAYQRYSGYHIDIAIDPDSGAVFRLSFQFDLKSTTPIGRSDIMIEYGPIEIGGNTYYCPLRSVSIMRTRSLRKLSDADEWFMSYGPYITMLNDVSFDRYHMFRSESHILTGFTPPEQ